MSSSTGEISLAAPLFSIGVTTYDRVDLLAETLSSILGQTFGDFEVIVGNDNPGRILSTATLGMHDARVRFVNHAQNLGELGNMNSLLKLARGRYFTWIADDDLYAPNFLEAVHAALRKFDFPPCVYTSYDLGAAIPEVINAGTEQLYSGREFLGRYLAGELKAIGTMGMFDRVHLEKTGGLEDLIGGSIALYTEYLHLIKTGLLERVVYVDAPLVIYRVHKGSWGCTTSDMDLFRRAGEELSKKSIEVFRSPQLVEDFSQNLRRYLQRFMSDFIAIANARHGESFNDRELLSYLIFSRRYLSSLKGSTLYWRSMLCLARVEKEIFWPRCKGNLAESRLISRSVDLIRRLASSIRLNLTDRPPDRERQLIRELRSNIRKLPARAIAEQSLAEDTWGKVINRLRYRIVHEDPRKFLEWGNLSTMFVGNASYVVEELHYLKQHHQWPEKWREAIVESDIGSPIRFPSYPESSGNLIHHAYHVSQFEEKTGRCVSDMDFIFEFGGGYGSMCRLIHGLGFTGKYVIFDFAEFSCLQSFFLKSMGLPVLALESFKTARSGILTLSDKDLLKDVFSTSSEQSLKSLFIATWSISETSIPFREEILGMVRAIDAFLIAYQDRFGEVDNIEFFSNLRRKREDIEWQSWEIQHIPGNRYLFGEKHVVSSSDAFRNEVDESIRQTQSA